MSKNNTVGIFEGKIVKKAVILDGAVDLGNLNDIYVTVDGKKAVAIYQLDGVVDWRNNQNHLVTVDTQIAIAMKAIDGVNDYKNYQSALMSVDGEMCVAIYLMTGTPTTLNKQSKMVVVDRKRSLAVYGVDGFFCFPKTGLLQYLGEKSDTQLLDTYNKGDAREVQQARAYELAGSQYIDTGVNDVLTSFVGEITFILTDYTSTVYPILFGKGTTGSSEFMFREAGGKLNLYVNGATVILNGGNLTLNVVHTAKVILTPTRQEVILDGVSTVATNTIDFSTTKNIMVGGTDESSNRFLTGRIFNYSYIINGGNEVVYNCEERAGNTSYSTTAGVTADIYGSLTGFHVIDHRKTTCYLDSVGFAIDNTNPDVAIPIGTDGTPVASYDTWDKGVVPKNVNFVNASCFHFIAGSNMIAGMTGLTVVDFIAESGVTPIISGDNLTTDVDGWVAMVELSNGAKLVFIGEGTSNTVYDVNNDTAYSIAGTITDGVSWITQDAYHFKEKYGYTAPNIPASLLNIGLDVLGATLEFPPCEIGSNDGSQKQYPLACDLIHADNDEIYFDKTTPELVVARELNNADLPENGGYTTWNKVDNCKMQGLMYDHNLSNDELYDIIKCYNKGMSLPIGKCILQDGSGNDLVDFNLMDLIIGDCV